MEPLESRIALAAVEWAWEEVSRFGSADDLYAADLDSDGDLDLLAARTEAGHVEWYENTHTAGFFDRAHVITYFARGPNSIYAADLDGDGDLDVLSASRWDDRIAWHENTDGRGKFGPQTVITNSAVGARSVRAADLDGDGDLDVLSASTGDNTIAWYENTGVAAFWPTRIISAEAMGARAVRVADLDGDGDPDVLSASASDNKIAWYENTNGRGQFGPVEVITASAADVRSVHTADLDGDGDMDILSASYGDHKVAWHENTDGAGAFGPPQVITTDACGVTSAITADLDGDGDTDVLWASQGSGVQWHEYLAERGTFAPEQSISTRAVSADAVFAADVDADQRTDVVADTSTRSFGPALENGLGFYRNLRSVARRIPPGDANEDGRFDRGDLIHVLQAGKYKSGEAATWSEGDFNGDGLFDQHDLVSALGAGQYWPPADDHGNNADSATAVDLLSATVGNIERCGDRDWYRLEAVAGTRYMFRVHLRTLRDSTLRLYGPDGATQLAFNDDDGFNRGSRIEWTALVSQTVYLKVSPFTQSDSGSYTLIVGTGEVMGAAVRVDIPQFRMSEHDPPQLATVMRTTPPWTSLVVSLTSNKPYKATVPPLVTIPAGASQATFSIQAVDDSIFDGVQSVFIGASAANHFGSGDSLFVFDDDGVSSPQDEHGDGPSVATHVDLPTSARGDINIRGDRDWFSFDAVAGNVYFLEVDRGTLASSVLRLIGPDGKTRLASDEVGATSIEWTAPADGRFFAEVASSGDRDAGSYTLRIRDSRILTLNISLESIQENGGASLVTVSRVAPSASNLLVNLTSSDPTRATVPPTVIIPAGRVSTIFQVTAVDNPVRDGRQRIAVSATVAGFVSASDTVVVLDDELGNVA